MIIQQLQHAIDSTLYQMNRVLRKLNRGETVLRAGESGSLDNDEELTADVVLADTAIAMLASSHLFHTIQVEGKEPLTFQEHQGLSAYIDPLDASLDYKVRGSTSILPYGGVITVVRDVETPKFDDIVAAGVMNFSNRNCDVWLGVYGSKGTLVNHNLAEPYSGPLELTKCPMIAEMYYPSNREKVVKAFRDQKGYLRNTGSAAVEMALVSSGQAIAFICDQQKGHELGAGYLLVTGAGGVVVDWKGEDYADKAYDFNSQYQVILAASREAADWVVGLLQRPPPVSTIS